MTKALQKLALAVVLAPALGASPSQVPPQTQAPTSPRFAQADPGEKRPVPTPLKILVVISRYESVGGAATKKISSLPYELAVTANAERTSLRMGSQVPVPGKDGGVSYMSVGTDIDCRAAIIDDSRFRVEVTISESSVIQKPGPFGAPTLQNFRIDNTVVLRDGQSTQFTSATDRTSGEIVKVDVTLNVEKQ